MPTVLRTGSYRFFFVSVDRGEPPHIHGRREDRVAKFWLDPVAQEAMQRYEDLQRDYHQVDFDAL